MTPVDSASPAAEAAASPRITQRPAHDDADAAPTTRARARCVWPVVVVVTLLALVLRLWLVGGLPLVITNDGVGYLRIAQRLAASADFGVIPAVRTPGYPLLLAGTYHVFGVNPVGVLITQALLGCAMTALLTAVAACLAGRWWALAVGVVAAADPWLIGIEHFALSEPLAMFLTAAAVALALVGKRPLVLVGIALGVTLGAAALTRPSCQTLIPFLLLGWAVRAGAGSWKRMGLCLVLGVVGVGMTLGPWVLFNRQREVSGVASGFSVMQWRSLLRYQILDYDYPADETLRTAMAEFRDTQPSWEATRAFAEEHFKRSDPQRPSLSAWNRASIAAKPGEFAELCGYATLWLLNYTPADGPKPGKASWIDWTLGRLAEDGDNKQYQGDPERLGLTVFVMDGSGGAARALVGWVHRHIIGGVPQIPLFALSALVVPLALLRRDWCLALVFTGALAFVAAHVAILFPVSRYLMPVWPLWFLALALTPWQIGLLVRDAWRWLRRERTAALETSEIDPASAASSDPS